MFLKNYTSDVPISTTIMRIEQTLIRCGVTGIEKDYRPDSSVVAITFKIELEEGKPMRVRLPANVKEAQEALYRDYMGDDLLPDGKVVYGSRKRRTLEDFRDQAERTSWKIIQDWVEVQMSMIQMKQADFREVFLPYFWDGRQTFFGRIKESGFRALLPEKT